MARTTIELSEAQKQLLKEERLSHESNYGETIERLCGEADTPYLSAAEVREIANEQISERVVPEAQR
jgi:hypothetical protein